MRFSCRCLTVHTISKEAFQEIYIYIYALDNSSESQSHAPIFNYLVEHTHTDTHTHTITERERERERAIVDFCILEIALTFQIGVAWVRNLQTGRMSPQLLGSPAMLQQKEQIQLEVRLLWCSKNA